MTPWSQAPLCHACYGARMKTNNPKKLHSEQGICSADSRQLLASESSGMSMATRSQTPRGAGHRRVRLPQVPDTAESDSLGCRTLQSQTLHQVVTPKNPVKQIPQKNSVVCRMKEGRKTPR